MQFGWTVNASDSHAVLTAALAAGINFIDTADIYSRWAAGNPGGVSQNNHWRLAAQQRRRPHAGGAGHQGAQRNACWPARAGAVA
jgi:aryl-alcohol dehydrogenase-like predicted oxidoreductase